MPRRTNKWIQQVAPKKGALHRQLGYPKHKPIPTTILRNIVNANLGTHVHGKTVTKLMKRRANFALNVR